MNSTHHGEYTDTQRKNDTCYKGIISATASIMLGISIVQVRTT